jgi:TetR/AcrR family fatty acid metabolism transcriptional regulator
MRSKNTTSGQHRSTFIEAARRAQIIECTIETLAVLGYAQTSLAHIAERAGINRGLILYYFTSKEELMRQVVTQIYTAGAIEMSQTIEAAPRRPRDQMHAYIQSNLQFIAGHPKEVRALGEIFLNMRHESGELAFGPEDEEPVLHVLEQSFLEGQATGEFRSFDARIMALNLRATIDKFSSLLGAGREVDLKSYIREMIELFDRATRKTQE